MGIILCHGLLCGWVSGREMYPAKEFKTGRGGVQVYVQPDRNRILIEDGKTNLLKQIDAAQFNPTPSADATNRMVRSTVAEWYKLAFGLLGPEEKHFLLRLSSGDVAAITLPEGEVLDPVPEALAAFANEALQDRALTLVRSDNAWERETGAWLCGQLELQIAIESLRKLLNDPAYYTVHGGDNWAIVMYVRRAARDALRLLGEDPGKVVVKIPEKAVEGAYTYHDVREGETLSKIAVHYYGEENIGRGMRAIMKANPSMAKEPGVRKGHRINIPPLKTGP
ncbi:MAG: LysM domain-containing protein [Verrucomicrobiota bacterium]